MKKIIIFCLLFCGLNAAAYCGQPSKIKLIDGSVINGEIVSYVNGVYTINTATFGEIKVGAAGVSKIESANYALADTVSSPVLQTSNSTQAQVFTYGQTLMKDPGNAAIITGLASDPQIQEMVSDPQLQDAAKTGDIQALLKNPKFLDIANSPKVQEAIKKLKK